MSKFSFAVLEIIIEIYYKKIFNHSVWSEFLMEKILIFNFSHDILIVVDAGCSINYIKNEDRKNTKDGFFKWKPASFII